MTFYCDGEEEKGDVDNTSFLSFVQIFLEELYAKILQNYICTGTSSILTYNYFYYPIFEITISFEIVSDNILLWQGREKGDYVPDHVPSRFKIYSLYKCCIEGVFVKSCQNVNA